MRSRTSRDWDSGPPTPLFCTSDLHATLAGARAEAQRAVEGYPANDLLSQPEDDVVAYIVASRLTEAPVLRPSDVAVAEHGESRIDVSHRFDYNVLDRSSPAYVPGERVEVAVPFDGDKNLFFARPNSFSSTVPYADVRDHELRLIYEDVQLNASGLKSRIEADVAAIQQHLTWIHAMTDPYDAELPTLVRAAVRSRKERLLRARNTVAALGLPVRRRNEPDGFSIPVTKKSVAVARPPAAVSAFEPEPLLADADFVDAVRVLIAMRNTIERLSRSTRNLSEESLRDILLVGLNSRFEGAAGGELFNGRGKTDILIRVDDRNAFIGECKIWRGPMSCREALDQLLGYTVWRDSKAALILFVRNKAATEVIRKAVTIISEHPRCKRNLAGSSPAEFRFVADGDEARETHLVLLPFVVSS